jgi:hypothetical protein
VLLSLIILPGIAATGPDAETNKCDPRGDGYLEGGQGQTQELADRYGEEVHSEGRRENPGEYESRGESRGKRHSDQLGFVAHLGQGDKDE